MLRHCRRDRCAKTLPDDDDALRRDLRDIHRPGHERDAIGDETAFGGVAGGVAEAAIVGCEDMDAGGGALGERAVGVGAPALGDGAGVTVDCERLLVRSVWERLG